MDSLKKRVLKQLMWFAVVASAFYIVGDSLHVIPQSVKDFVAWLAADFNTIALLICVILIVYLIHNYSTRRGRS